MAEGTLAMIGDFPPQCSICIGTAGWSPHNCPSNWPGFNPPSTPTFMPIQPIPVACDHCFCINEGPRTVGVKQEYSTDYVKTKSHQVCCSCQSRRLKPRRKAVS